MVRLCVDASFVLAWLIPGQCSPAVLSRMERYLEGEDDYVAPPLLLAEGASTLRRWVFQGRLMEEEGRQLVADLLTLGISVQSPPGLYSHAYDLATRFRQPRAYDACYLALADLLSCQILTLDQRLYNAVAGNFPLIRLVE